MRNGLETREELFAVMEQIAEEREAARPIVRELVARRQSIDDIEIPEGWRTAGMVLELCLAAQSIDEADPSKSLSLLHIALAITQSTSRRGHPPLLDICLEATTWNDIGWQHFYLGTFDAALRAYTTAESKFASTAALYHEFARAKLRHAQALAYIRQDSHALRLIAESKDIFHDFGDDLRIAMAEVIRATLHYLRGEIGIASSEYESLLSMKDRLDPRTLAAVYLNLGLTYVNLGRLSDALSAFEIGRDLFVESGIPLYRIDWGLARVQLENGEFAQAIANLKRLRDTFLKRKMSHDAGLVGLDIVEALIATDRFSEARRLTEQVLSEFQDAKLHNEAITSLAYLRDLIPKSQDARSAVRTVRSYVERTSYARSMFYLTPDERN